MLNFILGVVFGLALATAFIAYKTNQEDPDNEEYP